MYQHVLPGMQAQAAQIFDDLLRTPGGGQVTRTLGPVAAVTTPDELARKLEAAAAARGTTLDALATELLEGLVHAGGLGDG